jgi:hypothetical protein
MKVALALLIAGCGSDNVDLSGTYMVSTDVGSMPCGVDQPLLMTPAYLKFEQMELVGQKYFQYDGCSDAAATMCDGSGSLFNAFTEPTADGWAGVLTAWSGSGGVCALTYATRTATLKNKMLVIEIEKHEGNEMIADAQCTDAEAKKSGPTLPCVQHEHLEATKL